MLENADANLQRHDDEFQNSASEYLRRALEASTAGDAVLGMHLYLAAFEKAATESDLPSEAALAGLKQAWSLACTNKERALAEYIFEKMEPYLSAEEIAACAEQLQVLALDKLEEFGLSREDLEEMTEMISQDFLGVNAHIVKVESLVDPTLGSFSLKPPVAPPGIAIPGGAPSGSKLSVGPVASSSAAGQSDSTDAATGSGDSGHTLPTGSDSQPTDSEPETPAAYLAKASEELGVKLDTVEEPLTYDSLAGYNNVIQIMRDFGVGMKDDPDFKNLVNVLNARHGLDRMPAADTLLFRSPAREDANRFLVATLGELKLPSVRMRMEENLQGMPVLCVTAQAEDMPQLNSLRNAFTDGGVLVLEDIDLWNAPMTDMPEDPVNGFMMMQLSRGAREAMGLIRSAVENPDVYVLASASSEGEIDGFFLDMLEPLSLVDIDYPTPEERVDIWMDIAHQHPSIRHVNRADLVRLSANLPRYDIYMAAREAVEDAYKQGLMLRRYQPVTRDNIFDKLAAYQPLESREYRELEDAVVRDFRSDLSHLDDLLKDL